MTSCWVLNFMFIVRTIVLIVHLTKYFVTREVQQTRTKRKKSKKGRSGYSRQKEQTVRMASEVWSVP